MNITLDIHPRQYSQNIQLKPTMDIQKLVSQFQRLLIHQKAQKFARAVLSGSTLGYPHAKETLTPAVLKEALTGEKSIGIMLNQENTGLCKAGVMDIDIPRDSENLTTGLTLAKKLQDTAKNLNLSSYIEFSGNRGYHLWIFSKKAITAPVMQKALKVVAKKADFDCKEIFPNDYPKESKCIKLPGALHLKSNLRSGFIDSNFNPDKPENLPSQLELMSKFQQNEPEIIAKVADLLQETSQNNPPGQKSDIKEKLAIFGDSHPTCIDYLLNNGIPLEIDYNHGNLSLARYCLSKGLDLETGIKLATMVAKNTPENHPTGKDETAKVNNFKSAYKSAQSKNYQFKCSYILANKGNKPLSERGCIGTQCKACDWSGNSIINPPKQETPKNPQIFPYNPLIFRVIGEISLQGGEACKSEILAGVENLLKEYSPPEKTISESRLLQESEILGYLLNEPDKFTYYSDLPYEGFEGGSNLSLGNYLDYLLNLELPSQETLEKNLDLIRENGIRKLANKKVGGILQDTETEITKSLDNVINESQILLKRAVSDKQIISMAEHLPELTEDLFSLERVSIPSESQHLNNILNGGFMPGKLYILGAPPGSGKSTLSAWIGDYAAMNNHKVIYASYEMSREQLFIASLARIENLNSAVIESKKFINDDYPHKETLESRVLNAISNYGQKIAPNMTIIEADINYTPYKLKTIIKKLETDLIIVDYLQLLQTGDEKLDNTNQETLRVSRIATELKRLARETKAAVIAISDINKAAYLSAIAGGDLDMGALRDSFKIAHSADVIMLLQSGKISLGKGENKSLLDQLDLVAKKYPDDQRKIFKVRENYPLDSKKADTYSRLTIVKNRGGKLGEPIFKYSKALHKFEPINLNLQETEIEIDF